MRIEPRGPAIDAGKGREVLRWDEIYIRRQCALVSNVGHPFGRPSAKTSRRTGDSVDWLAALREGCEDVWGATSAHIFGQSSMGNGESNIAAGIIALKCITAALVVNSGHAYSALQSSQRVESTARSL